MKILAMTVCCVDHFPELNKIYVGGNSLNFATASINEGIKNVSIIGAVGKDSFGKLIKKHLSNTKIDISHLYETNYPTASNKIFISKNGDRYFKPGSWNGGAFEAFRLAESDWKFMKSFDIIAIPKTDPNFKEALKRKNKAQLLAADFLDCKDINFIMNTIKNIDISFISGNELMIPELYKVSTKAGKMVVLTLGEKGSRAFYRGKEYIQEAVPVEKVIDTTGCGDAFQAAFTISMFKDGSIQKALLKGALAASKVLTFVGGVK